MMALSFTPDESLTQVYHLQFLRNNAKSENKVEVYAADDNRKAITYVLLLLVAGKTEVLP